MVNLLNPSDIVQSGGLILIAVIVFAEVGLLLGFVLPGDTLLIAAGIYAHEGKIAVVPLISITIVAAITGDSLAYYWGRKLGPQVFKRDDGIMFNKGHVERAEKFYGRYGAKALLITHFLPVIRAFMPMLAGVAKMPYKRFLAFNIPGDILWAVSVTLVGYFIGSKVPGVDKYILLLVLAAVLFSALPTLYHYFRTRAKQRQAASSRPKAERQ